MKIKKTVRFLTEKISNKITNFVTQKTHFQSSQLY